MNQQEFFDDDWYAELLDSAAAIVIAYMYGCRCGNECWICAIGFKKPTPDHPSCLSAAGAEVVYETWAPDENGDRAGGAAAVASRRRNRAPPLDGNQAARLLNDPRVWRTVEDVAQILLHGVENAREDKAIARLLERAGLPLPEGA